MFMDSKYAPPSLFQKGGLTESQLLEGVPGKAGSDFFQGVGLQFSHNK